MICAKETDLNVYMPDLLAIPRCRLRDYDALEPRIMKALPIVQGVVASIAGECQNVSGKPVSHSLEISRIGLEVDASLGQNMQGLWRSNCI